MCKTKLVPGNGAKNWSLPMGYKEVVVFDQSKPVQQKYGRYRIKQGVELTETSFSSI